MGDRCCYFCGNDGKVDCGSCGKVSACCHAHLQLHWRGEGQCFPWTVLDKPEVGRCMLTTRKVLAGETLFQENPVVIGPNQEGSPICLACYSSIGLDYLCSSCGYPLCGPDCETSIVHRDECVILSRGPTPTFQEDGTEAYHCILPLRLLLLSRSDPDQFGLTNRLMDHEQERSKGSDWQITERTVVDYLVNQCRAGEMENVTAEEVRRAVGVLEVNSYEVHSFISCGYRGCFPAASLLSHGCRANSRHIWSTSSPYTNTCIATVDLEEGEEIITSYHTPTVCSLLRRPKLLEGWYFQCGCKRCSSADELGTHLNTVRCGNCSQPALLPATPLSIGSDWICRCNHRESEKDVLVRVTKLLEDIKTLTKQERYNVSAWLQLLDTAETIVHPNHAAILEICKWMLPILCRNPESRTEDFDGVLLLRKLDLATRQRALLDVIDPGLGKTRGKALYEEVEIDIYLKIKELDNDDMSSLSAASLSDIAPRLAGWKTTCDEIMRIFDRLGCNPGFEKVLRGATENIHTRCSNLEKSLGDSSFVEEWRNFRDGWSFLQLWRWRN